MPQEVSWPWLARHINALRRRERLEPLLREADIEDFEEAVRDAALKFRLPPGSDGLDQHQWSPEQRVEFREALSELHRAALEIVGEEGTRRLMNLFEMTTVTKKLRRIACLNRDALVDATRQIRPHCIDLTFMNYEFPKYWFRTPAQGEGEQEMYQYVQWIEETCHVPVRLVSFGPRSDSTHIVDRKVSPL